MENIRLNKEYVLDIDNFFDIKYGSVNRLNPLVIYISCKTWICPNKEVNFKNIIGKALCEFKQKLKNIIISCDNYDNKFIYDDFINYNGMKINKKNYFSIEIYIRRNDCDEDLFSLKKDIEYNFKHLFNELSLSLNNDCFKLTKSKN